MAKDFKFGMMAGMIFSAVFLVYYLVSSSPEQSDSARAVSASEQDGQNADGDNMNMTVLPLRTKEQGYLPEGGEQLVDRFAQVSQRQSEQQTSGSEATSSSPVTQKKPPRMYTVVSGDTLSDISRKFYGTTTKWQIILDANRKTMKNPAELKPGMELVIPEEQ